MTKLIKNIYVWCIKLLYLRLFSGFYLCFLSYGEKTVVFAGMYWKLWCRNTSMLTLDGNSLDICVVTILLAKEKKMFWWNRCGRYVQYFLNNDNRYGNSYLFFPPFYNIYFFYSGNTLFLHEISLSKFCLLQQIQNQYLHH